MHGKVSYLLSPNKEDKYKSEGAPAFLKLVWALFIKSVKNSGRQERCAIFALQKKKGNGQIQHLQGEPEIGVPAEIIYGAWGGV